MKLSKIALTLIVAATVATPALRASEAGSGAYLTLDAGVNLAQDVTITSPNGRFSDTVSMDPGFRIGLIAGYNINEWVGVELETGFLYNGVKEINGVTVRDENDVWFGSIPVLANVVFRYEKDNKFVPYVGAGAGGAYAMIEGNGIDGDSVFVFAWQLKAGVAYKVSDNMAIDLGYKFFSTAEQEYSDFKAKDIYSHYIGLSLTFKF
jgi:opacity protein-like surface antigen